MPNPLICNNLRLSVIDAGCLRLEYSETGEFCDHPTLFAAKRSFDFSAFTSSQDGDDFHLSTDRLDLIYRSQYGKIRPLVLEIKLPDGTVWSLDSVNSGNLGGTVESLDNKSKPCPLSEGLLSRDGWYVIDDSRTPLLIGDRLQPRPFSDHYLDLYFFAYGHDYKAALASLIEISGPVPMPPRFLMGSWYSRWFPYTSEDYRKIVEEYAQNGFPLDNMVMDMEWHTRSARDGAGWGGTLGWTGWSWNRELLPDAEELLKFFKAHNIRVVMNAHPHDGVRQHETMYADFMRELGESAANGRYLEFDAGSPRYMAAYFKHTHVPREKEGVDVWWVDWQQDTIFPWLKGLPGVRHQLWLNRCYYRHMANENRRGVSFSRWGGWGDHRHPICFSGDVVSNWEMLAFEIPFTAIAGNCGCFFWSHDMGGFWGERNEELYARWIQFGAVSAAMRLHSVGDDLDRRPWKWSPLYCESMRHSFELRARLMPYLYTMVHAACEQSVPLIRPMYLEHSEQEAAYRQPQQFYLGEHLIAAPIVSPGSGAAKIAFQSVWFADDEWYNVFTGEQFAAGEHLVGADIDEFPLYVRGGLPLPLGRMGAQLTAIPEHLDVTVFPAAVGCGRSFSLYEDDGVSPAYRRGQFARTLFRYERSADRHSVNIGACSGSYAGQPAQRSYTVILRNIQAVHAVEVNGQAATCQFDAIAHICRVELPASAASQEWRVAISAEVIAPEIVRREQHERRSVGMTPEDRLRLQGCGARLKNESKYYLEDATSLKVYPGGETSFTLDIPGKLSAHYELQDPTTPVSFPAPAGSAWQIRIRDARFSS